MHSLLGPLNRHVSKQTTRRVQDEDSAYGSQPTRTWCRLVKRVGQSRLAEILVSHAGRRCLPKPYLLARASLFISHVSSSS